MNKLKKFLSKKRGRRSELARTLKAHASDVSDWCNGFRQVPPHYCCQIEDFSCGEVTRKDLRPDDWQKYWPELAETA
jgi:DNA-binding transcriptional regulator YdaS (Cro superfamily)